MLHLQVEVFKRQARERAAKESLGAWAPAVQAGCHVKPHAGQRGGRPHERRRQRCAVGVADQRGADVLEAGEARQQGHKGVVWADPRNAAGGCIDCGAPRAADQAQRAHVCLM